MVTWLSGWGYRKYHAITGSISGSIATGETNYQMKFTVHTGSGTDAGADVYLNNHINVNFSDIRFQDTGSNLIDYWIETTGSSGENATIWVEIPSIPSGSTSTGSIYMYYGSSSAISLSSGANTFLFFDDFDEATINLNRWTSSSAVTLTFANSWVTGSTTNNVAWQGILGKTTMLYGRWKCKGQMPDAAANYYELLGLANAIDLSDSFAMFYYTPTYGKTKFTQYNGSGTYGVITWDATAIHTWETLWCLRKTNYQSVQYLIDDVDNLYLTGAKVPAEACAASAVVWSGNGVVTSAVKMDWIFQGKYISPEPAHGIWELEEPIYADKLLKSLPRFTPISDKLLKIAPQFTLYNDTIVKIFPRYSKYSEELEKILPRFIDYSEDFIKIYPQLTEYIDLIYMTLLRFTEQNDELVKVLPSYKDINDEFIKVLPQLLQYDDKIIQFLPKFSTYDENLLMALPKLAKFDDNFFRILLRLSKYDEELLSAIPRLLTFDEKTLQALPRLSENYDNLFTILATYPVLFTNYDEEFFQVLLKLTSFDEKQLQALPRFISYSEEFLEFLPKLTKYNEETLQMLPKLARYGEEFIKVLIEFLSVSDQVLTVLPKLTGINDNFIKTLPRLYGLNEEILAVLPRFGGLSEEFISLVPQFSRMDDSIFKMLVRLSQSNDEILQMLPQFKSYYDRVISMMPMFTSTFDKFIQIIPKLLTQQDLVTKAMPRLMMYKDQFLLVTPKLGVMFDYSENLVRLFAKTTEFIAALFGMIYLGDSETTILGNGGIYL